MKVNSEGALNGANGKSNDVFAARLNEVTNEDGSEYEDENIEDSDEELQKAFVNKLIKPGLNIEINKPRAFINNQDALTNKYKDIYQEMDWVERFDITVDKQLIDTNMENPDEIVDNDFKREHTFYLQAQAAALEGLAKLHKLGVNTKRPEDYFAEMAKSDEHMKKVKEALLSKQAELEKREKARKLRELKKIGKQVQIESIKKKNKDKKKFNQSMDKLKKGDKTQLSALEDDDNNVNGSGSGSGGANKNKRKKDEINNPIYNKNNKLLSKKRKFKDNKYGFGGKKKRSKYNTSDSSANVDDFNPRIHGKISKNKKFQNKNKPKKIKK